MIPIRFADWYRTRISWEIIKGRLNLSIDWPVSSSSTLVENKHLTLRTQRKDRHVWAQCNQSMRTKTRGFPRGLRTLKGCSYSSASLFQRPEMITHASLGGMAERVLTQWGSMVITARTEALTDLHYVYLKRNKQINEIMNSVNWIIDIFITVQLKISCLSTVRDGTIKPIKSLLTDQGSLWREGISISKSLIFITQSGTCH